MEEITSIGILGSGKMGNDFFNFFDDYSFSLVMVCENSELAEKYRGACEKKLKRQLKNGLIDEDEAIRRSEQTLVGHSPELLSRCDLVIEALPEDLSLKSRLFSEVESLVSPQTILASNSSSLLPSAVFSGVDKKERCLGLHFFYPVKLKNICEIITMGATSVSVLEKVRGLLASLDRFFLVQKEGHAFALNRLFLDYQALGFWYHQEQGVSIRSIDELVKKELFPEGLFSLFDSVGIDTMLSSVTNYAAMEPDPLYGPLIDALQVLVEQGKLGMKSGEGFFSHDDNEQPGEEAPVGRDVFEGLRAAYINAAFHLVETGLCSAEDMDRAVSEYTALDKGPAELAKDLGEKKIVAVLEGIRSLTGSDRFKPSQLLME